MTLQVVSANLRTGRVIADLPSCDVDYPLRRTIGQYESATAHLNLDGAPVNWQDAVQEGAAVLHVYDDQDPAKTPQWSGIVTLQVRDATSDVVDLTLSTCESYFDRRYVGNKTYTAVGQNSIVADLMTTYVVDGAQPGLPITFSIAAVGPGTVRDRTWRDSDNATVYSRLQQLMAVQGGPEFTVEWAWTADGEHIKAALIIAGRIGMAPRAGLDPATTWAMPGAVLDCQQVRDYSAGKGANKVTAYSSGQGESTPLSAVQYAASFDSRPTYEHRWSPSTSISSAATLATWAKQALKLLAPGARALTLTAARDRAPRYGVDWTLGDDLGYSIGGVDDHGQETVRAFPGGLTGTGRCIAYEVSELLITPILAQSEIYTEDGS